VNEHRSDESGSMMPLLALLIFTGLVVLGLALDVALLGATYRRAAFAADAGAEAGAAMLSVDDAYAGIVVLDPAAAEQVAVEAAMAARTAEGRTVTAGAQPDRVCTTVVDHYTPRIIGSLGLGPATVTVTACAEPGRG
jgi:hypothetical protein